MLDIFVDGFVLPIGFLIVSLLRSQVLILGMLDFQIFTEYYTAFLV